MFSYQRENRYLDFYSRQKNFNLILIYKTLTFHRHETFHHPRFLSRQWREKCFPVKISFTAAYFGEFRIHKRRFDRQVIEGDASTKVVFRDRLEVHSRNTVVGGAGGTVVT